MFTIQRRVCVQGLRTASERRGLKLASAYWCGRRGHVSVSLKIAREIRWGGVFPADQTQCHCGDASPNKSTAVRARFCLDPHLYFPTAPPLTCEPGENSGSPVLYLATSPPLHKHREELQRRNPHFSKTAVTRTWRVFFSPHAEAKTHILPFSNKYSGGNKDLKWKISQGKQDMQPSRVSDCELQMSVDN